MNECAYLWKARILKSKTEEKMLDEERSDTEDICAWFNQQREEVGLFITRRKDQMYNWMSAGRKK